MTTPVYQYLLIIDDDIGIRNLLGNFLGQYGFRTAMARHGKEALQLISIKQYDLIILDIMLPGIDGLTLCPQLRQLTPAPIIMLTAMSTEADRVIGLELGADDYLTKPFNPRELLARIKAVLRRAKNPNADSSLDNNQDMVTYNFSKWCLHKPTRRLFSTDNMEVNLSTGEYDLLLAFVTHPLRILTRDQLLDFAKNRSGIPFDRSIDVQISRLRQKIETDPKQPELIKTIRGGGYMLTAGVTIEKYHLS